MKKTTIISFLFVLFIYSTAYTYPTIEKLGEKIVQNDVDLIYYDEKFDKENAYVIFSTKGYRYTILYVPEDFIFSVYVGKDKQAFAEFNFSANDQLFYKDCSSLDYNSKSYYKKEDNALKKNKQKALEFCEIHMTNIVQYYFNENS